MTNTTTGLYFEPPLLLNQWADVNQDGYMDLVVWGTAVTTDDSDTIVDRHPVKASFVFDPLTQKFRVTAANPDI